mmetsp:Transcript_2556/g.6371  ORF Transcript_2556/g.6371 Transcript_2556/m.6371 type:complete len:206 (-) Transcript_2556:39-656(-)
MPRWVVWVLVLRAPPGGNTEQQKPSQRPWRASASMPCKTLGRMKVSSRENVMRSTSRHDSTKGHSSKRGQASSSAWYTISMRPLASSPSIPTSSVHTGLGFPGCQPITRSLITSSGEQSSASHAPDSNSCSNCPGPHSVAPRKNLNRPSASADSATRGFASVQPPSHSPSRTCVERSMSSTSWMTKRELCFAVPPSHSGEIATQP